ncbi:MAG TPA: glycosyltransferase [Bdellovibrionales bacterium]|nr:glycosyltransferase [Bdellovibrionales bacterium]
MKIALLHDSVLPPKTYGGIERIVVNLAYEYRRLGHDVVVICRKGSQLADFETFELPVGYQSADPSTWLPKGIDFLHSHQPLPLKPSIPFLVTIHGNGHEGERYWKNTNFLSESHARNHSAKYFVFNGVDPDRYPYKEKKQDYFVFLARTTWRVKNLKTCIAWANDLGVRLEIMGGSGVSRGNIRYHGLVDEPQKIELLSNARALIYPTNWDEPCAAAPLEALACGTPVITSVNGCMPELVRPGTGVVCATYADLLRAPEALKTIQPRACRDSIETFFSLRRMAQDYMAVFDRVLKQGELDHQPKYSFDPKSIRFLYKPTITNRLRYAVTGKI